MNAQLTAGIQGSPSNWQGVVRDGKRVVWCCGHCHSNRDNSTLYNYSARDCAKGALWVAQATDVEIAEKRKTYAHSTHRYAAVSVKILEHNLACLAGFPAIDRAA
ncbi:MAG: hypothetical protein GHHEDOFH_01565 [Pseudorhodoplanes sp.]|nr:hypothetical protein [Pseudorhodoplanes sp.]